MAEHDSGYKLLFSHPRMVEELLRGFVHEPWVEELDFGTLEQAEASFTSADLQERHSDRVWRLRNLTEWLKGAKSEGRRAGRQEGKVEGMRQLLVQLLEQRFGTLPLGVRRRVRAIDSPKELGALAKRVLVAGSLAEMGLG